MCKNHFWNFFCPRIFFCYNMCFRIFLCVAPHRPNFNSHLTSASSTKSMLSAAARAFNQCSTPLDNNNSGEPRTAQLGQHRSFCKRSEQKAAVIRQLMKSDSVNSFSSILATKPGLNAFQSSLSSTGS